ncbi:MAG TPA: glycoside hydrolase family 125 protein [Propionibacteriaceae bacterium]|nr:glycoside hydrolase family 125 protein [Propionibacteriaceae bacterium]
MTLGARARSIRCLACRELNRHLGRTHIAPVHPLPPGVRSSIESAADDVRAVDAELAVRFTSLMVDAWERSFVRHGDRVSALTGDIPAMWLRDSAAQLRPWYPLASDSPDVADLIAGVVRRQWDLIALDPRANAFTLASDDRSWHLLDRDVPAGVWERKYELDSCAWAIQSAWLYRASTHERFDAGALDGMRETLPRVLALWRAGQHHDPAGYRFRRPFSRDALPDGGRGRPVGHTGMTWSGFRPSDDPCHFGYHIPANLFAAHALQLAGRLASELWCDADLAADCRALASDITAGVDAFGMTPDGRFAYEVDGLGCALELDDANAPSLLSLPLFSDIASTDPRYLATRDWVLSPANSTYHHGRVISGIGSPHTPGRRVWPLALAIEGLTSPDTDEKLTLARIIASTDAGTGRVHESVHADDASRSTRAWFAWGEASFCELLLDLGGRRIPRPSVPL